jgi:hypothetical protein
MQMKVELVKFDNDKNEDITTHTEEENVLAIRLTLKNKKRIEIILREEFPGCVSIRTTNGRLMVRPDCSNVIHIKPVKM